MRKIPYLFTYRLFNLMKKHPLLDKQFWHPRYWLTWVALGMLRLVVFLPYRAQIKIGRSLGIMSMYFLRRRRHITEVNLRLCFPNYTPAQRKQLLIDNFGSVGIGLIETAMTWWLPISKLAKMVHITGGENLDNALAKGRGILLLGAHFTTLDFAGRLTTSRYPFFVTYRSSKNKLIDAFLLRSRNEVFDEAISRNTLRTMVRKLQENKIVWYAPDQDYGRKHSVFAPFFGVQAASVTATARIAKMTGCAVVPACQYRLADGSGYECIVYPAIENFPTGDEVADATRINQLVERAILHAPEQYLWQHRRFKTRPLGEARPY